MKYSSELEFSTERVYKKPVQTQVATTGSFEKIKTTLTTIACLTFFPGVYFLGRFIMEGYTFKTAELTEIFFWM